MGHGSGEQQTLCHPAGQGRDVGVGPVGQSEELEESVRGPRSRPRSHAEVPSVEVEVLPDRQASIERVRLGNHADPRFGRWRVCNDVDAGDDGLTRCGDDPRRQHPDGGGLACAVRSEQAEDLAGPDVQVEGVDGFDTGGVDLR